jgi:Zn-dependent protease
MNMGEAALANGDVAIGDDSAFQAVVEQLRKPKQTRGNAAPMLLISLTAFVAVAFAIGQRSIGGVLVLVGVLFLHEMGHAVAMRLFGYRDVRILFIPFFGALATGVNRAVPVWQRTVVLLAGPVPGLLLGITLHRTGADTAGSLVSSFVTMLIGINALNLLPIEPLDGGRLVGLLVFGGMPRLRAIVGSIVGVVFVFLFAVPPFAKGGMLAILIAAHFIRWRAAKVAANLREHGNVNWNGAPADIALADVDVLRPLFFECQAAFKREAPTKPVASIPVIRYATLMRQCYDLLQLRRPPILLAAPVVLLFLGFIVVMGRVLLR